MSGGLYANTNHCHDEYPNSFYSLLFRLNLLVKKADKVGTKLTGVPGGLDQPEKLAFIGKDKELISENRT